MITTPEAIIAKKPGEQRIYVICAMEEEEHWDSFLTKHTDESCEEVNMGFDRLDSFGMVCYSFTTNTPKNKKLAERLIKAKGVQAVTGPEDVKIKDGYVVLHREDEYPWTPEEAVLMRCKECRKREWDNACMCCPNTKKLNELREEREKQYDLFNTTTLAYGSVTSSTMFPRHPDQE